MCAVREIWEGVQVYHCVSYSSSSLFFSTCCFFSDNIGISRRNDSVIQIHKMAFEPSIIKFFLLCRFHALSFLSISLLSLN